MTDEIEKAERYVRNQERLLDNYDETLNAIKRRINSLRSAVESLQADRFKDRCKTLAVLKEPNDYDAGRLAERRELLEYVKDRIETEEGLVAEAEMESFCGNKATWHRGNLDAWIQIKAKLEAK